MKIKIRTGFRGTFHVGAGQSVPKDGLDRIRLRVYD